MEDLQELGTTIATLTEVKTTIDGSISIKLSLPASAINLGQALLSKFVHADTNLFVSFVDQHGSKIKETPSIYDL